MAWRRILVPCADRAHLHTISLVYEPLTRQNSHSGENEVVSRAYSSSSHVSCFGSVCPCNSSHFPRQRIWMLILHTCLLRILIATCTGTRFGYIACCRPRSSYALSDISSFALLRSGTLLDAIVPRRYQYLLCNATRDATNLLP